MVFVRYMGLVIAGLILLTSFEVKAAEICPSVRPSVSVKSVIKPTKYVRTKSAQGLTDLHSGGRPAGGGSVLGLGGGEIGIKAQNQYKTVQQGGRTCVVLVSVQAVFYSKPKIHIASNFKRGSCEYSAVLAHERKHVKTLRDFHRRHVAGLKKVLRKISREAAVKGRYPVSQANNIQKEISNEMSRKIQNYTNVLLAKLSSKQRAIDTPEEYRRVAKKCKKWDEKLNRS